MFGDPSREVRADDRGTYELLGEQRDSKEVAMMSENFVMRGKAFFLRYLRPKRVRLCPVDVVLTPDDANA